MRYKFSHYVDDHIDTTEIRGKDGIYYWLKSTVEWADVLGNVYFTPINIVSDGFSVPKVFWGLLARLDSRIPSFVHDAAYWLQYCSKKTADYNIYAGICSFAVGEKRFKRFLIRSSAKAIWAGLKLGGWKAWNGYKKQLDLLGYAMVLKEHTAETLEEAKEIANG